MNREDLDFIQDSIGYQFHNEDLLIQAFIRRSYSQENGGEDNEVLEFIGDRALDIVVVKSMVDSYGSFYHDYETDMDVFTSEYDEGELTQIKANLVKRHMLASRMDLLGFADFLIMGQGDISSRVDKNEAVKEDLFEAIIGAVALDSGWNMDALQEVVYIMLDLDAELYEGNGEKNYIRIVREWSVENEGDVPFYKTQNYYGYRSSHSSVRYGNEVYPPSKTMCMLELPGVEMTFFGFGRSIHEQRNDAARLAYEYLVENALITTIRDEIDNPNYADAIGQLETLARRGYFSLPVYSFDESYDDDGNPVWDCECTIDGIDNSEYGSSSSKKDAKKQAAYKMLMRVIDEG